jgi:hypothetical protein
MWERDCGRGRGTKKTKAIRYGACYYSIVFTRIGCSLLTCDMYMSDLRHIHDPVLSSLKMEGIRLFSWRSFYLHVVFGCVTWLEVIVRPWEHVVCFLIDVVLCNVIRPVYTIQCLKCLGKLQERVLHNKTIANVSHKHNYDRKWVVFEFSW